MVTLCATSCKVKKLYVLLTVNLYYYYYYLLQLSFHSVAVVLTLVINKKNIYK